MVCFFIACFSNSGPWFVSHDIVLVVTYLLFDLGSYLSAITEKITGRDEDTCPDSTGNAKNDMGDARMDIFRSEIACEGRES